MISVKNSPKGNPPSIYSYADQVSKALLTFNSPSMKFAGCTMQKSTGRDNAMYNVSENNNLNIKDENAFGTLLSMSSNLNGNNGKINDQRSSTLNKPFVASSSTFNPQMKSLQQITSLFKTNKGSIQQEKNLENKKYSMLLNYASQVSMDIADKRNGSN